jgi:hypothetical protein
MKTKSTPGLQRFQLQLDKLDQLLVVVAKSKNPGTALFQSPARQILFFLESLARIYKGAHNKKRFERMRLAFKSLEDQLGKVDYYDAFINEFSKQKGFPKELLANLKKHYTAELNTLDQLLKNDGWIDAKKTKWNIIQQELTTADWKSKTEDRKSVGKAIKKQIEEIELDYRVGRLNFNDLELGVHEFRRQLRWISIYAQALDGLIQLKKTTTKNAALKKYLIKEVMESPFNKMPIPKNDIPPITIQSSYFYGLSWLIAESGKLKDEGLRIICIENALKEIGVAKEKDIPSLAKKWAVNSKKMPEQIKNEMKIIADTFMYDANILATIKKDIKQAIKK